MGMPSELSWWSVQLQNNFNTSVDIVGTIFAICKGSSPRAEDLWLVKWKRKQNSHVFTTYFC